MSANAWECQWKEPVVRVDASLLHMTPKEQFQMLCDFMRMQRLLESAKGRAN